MMKKAMMKKAIMNSISDILETMFYMSIEFKEIQGFMEDFSQSDEIILSSIIFKGSISGEFHIYISLESLSCMAENFMGVDYESLTEDYITGIIKEFVNMLAGSTLSSLDNREKFQLSIPEIKRKAVFDPKEISCENNIVLLAEIDSGFIIIKTVLN